MVHYVTLNHFFQQKEVFVVLKITNFEFISEVSIKLKKENCQPNEDMVLKMRINVERVR